MDWGQYKRKGLSEMRPYVEGEDMSGVSMSEADKANGSPKLGDMIARNPNNHNDKWLVAKAYFDANLEPSTTPKFDFEIGQDVLLVDSKEAGIVLGRAEYRDSTPSYYVRYVDANGRMVKDWFNGPDLVAK